MQVVDCRKEYTRRGLPTVFKMLSFAESTDLDELFAADAYLRAAETSVQSAFKMILWNRVCVSRRFGTTPIQPDLQRCASQRGRAGWARLFGRYSKPYCPAVGYVLLYAKANR